MQLIETLQAALDSTDLDDRNKLIEATRFAAFELIMRDIDSVGFEAGPYKIELKITNTRE